jgi:hypothetical protein
LDEHLVAVQAMAFRLVDFGNETRLDIVGIVVTDDRAFFRTSVQ